MKLKYHWENVIINEEISGANVRTIAPHTKEVVADVDYEYEADVEDKDVLDFLGMHEDRRHNGQEVLDFLNKCNAIDYESLENDKDFVEFMTEKYKDDAWEEFQEGNEAY